MLHRARSLVAVLALSIPTLAAAQPKKAPDPVSTYLQQEKYTYCDVKILSALWKQSVSDAKATVGLKLQNKGEKQLDTALVTARANARKNASLRCTFAEAGFSFDDAKTLAKMWKKTESAAKVMAEEKILAGGEPSLRELLKKPGTGSVDDPTSVYLKQDKYTYCDVKLLSQLWKVSIDDAKAAVGAKLQSKSETLLNSDLLKARKAPKKQCTWSEAGLTYADVEAVAKAWKISVAQAKVKLNKKVTANGTDFIKELTGAGSGKQQDLNAFLDQTKYTYCDAASIGAMWKQSVEDGKTFIGLKLRLKNTTALDKVVADAKAFAANNLVKGCEGATTKPAVPPPPKTKPALPPPAKKM
jgi:hypothetical protein